MLKVPGTKVPDILFPHGEPSSRAFPIIIEPVIIIIEPETGPRRADCFFPTGILTTLLGPMLTILIARWAMNDTQAGNLFLLQFLAMLMGVQLSGVLLLPSASLPSLL